MTREVAIRGSMNHAAFDRLIDVEFPEAAAELDAGDRQSLHDEMAAVARATARAIEAGNTSEVGRHLAVMEQVLTAAAAEGARRGQVFATATMLARDLANTPHNHLSASRLAEVAVALGAQRGFEVEVFDEKALREMSLAWSPWREVAARILWAYYRAVRGREGVR